MLASTIASIAVLLSFFGYPTAPYVIAPDGTTHHTCVDVGRTFCADGSVFGPAVPAPTTTCDTDADCASKHGRGGYGTD